MAIPDKRVSVEARHSIFLVAGYVQGAVAGFVLVDLSIYLPAFLPSLMKHACMLVNVGREE